MACPKILRVEEEMVEEGMIDVGDAQGQVACQINGSLGAVIVVTNSQDQYSILPMRSEYNFSNVSTHDLAHVYIVHKHR